jgi:hypothetical protein
MWEIPRAGSRATNSPGTELLPTYCRAMREKGEGCKIEAVIVGVPAEGEPEPAMQTRLVG